MTIVTTMRGKRIDITAIISKYENTIAIGNASLNARGDKIGPGGKIVRRKEEIVSDYYRSNPKAVKQVSLREISPDVFDTPADAVAATRAARQQQQQRRKLNDKED